MHHYEAFYNCKYKDTVVVRLIGFEIVTGFASQPLFALELRGLHQSFDLFYE
jgi:hypothetical protein